VLEDLGRQAQEEGRSQCGPDCVPGAWHLITHEVEPYGNSGEICTLRVHLQCQCIPRPRSFWNILWNAVWKTALIVIGAVIIVYGGIYVIGALATQAARDPKKAGEIIRFAKALRKAA